MRTNSDLTITSSNVIDTTSSSIDKQSTSAINPTHDGQAQTNKNETTFTKNPHALMLYSGKTTAATLSDEEWINSLIDLASGEEADNIRREETNKEMATSSSPSLGSSTVNEHLAQNCSRSSSNVTSTKSSLLAMTPGNNGIKSSVSNTPFCPSPTKRESKELHTPGQKQALNNIEQTGEQIQYYSAKKGLFTSNHNEKEFESTKDMKKERNRQYARLSRERKRQQVENMEQHIERLVHENKRLRQVLEEHLVTGGDDNTNGNSETTTIKDMTAYDALMSIDAGDN